MVAALAVFVIVVSASFAVFWIEPLGALIWLERLTPNLRYRVKTRQPLVALSFDD